MHEIGGVATVEGTAEIGSEGIADTAFRGSHVLSGMCGDVLVEQLTVGRSDVLHISHILQASFYLERHGTGFDELSQMGTEVEVFQREQVALMLQLTAVGIEQVELHPAELRTLTTVGRAAETVFRGIAAA